MREDRAVRGVLTSLLALAVLVPAAALAHIGVSPAFVRAGEPARLALEVPNEREGRAMTAFFVRVPAGARVLSAEPAAGWTARRTGREAAWRGSLPAGETVTLALTLQAPGPPGALDLKAEQLYADGGVVRWTVRVTVAPAAAAPPPMRIGWALGAGIAGLVVIAAGLALVLVRRRRRLP